MSISRNFNSTSDILQEVLFELSTFQSKAFLSWKCDKTQ